MVKMKKPSKRRALSASWEGPYQFVGHVDGKGDFDFEEGCRICLSKMQMGVNGRGLEEIYRSITLLRIELRDSAFSKREGLHM
jgi:hypothetical protein